jgi:hypothetical protein
MPTKICRKIASALRRNTSETDAQGSSFLEEQDVIIETILNAADIDPYEFMIVAFDAYPEPLSTRWLTHQLTNNSTSTPFDMDNLL